MKSNEAVQIPKQKTFLDIRKQLYEREQQQMIQYQQSFRKSFEDEMSQMQVRQQFLIKQMQARSQVGVNLNSDSKVKPKTSNQTHRRAQLNHQSDPSAININTIQYINNSSLRNTKTSQDKRYNGSDQFFQQYVTPTSSQLVKRAKNRSDQRQSLSTPQYQTFLPGSQQHIQSQQIKPLSTTSQAKLFSPHIAEQGRPISMQESKRRILKNLDFIEKNMKDEGYAEFKQVETETLNKHVMFNSLGEDIPFNKRNMHTDKVYFNHHMSRHSHIPEYKKNGSATHLQSQTEIDKQPLSKETEEQIKKIAQKVSQNIGDQFFLFSVAKNKTNQNNDSSKQKESEYERTRRNIKNSKSTKNLDIPLRDLLIQDPKKRNDADQPVFYLNLQQSIRNTWQRSKKQVEEMMNFNNELIEDFKRKKMRIASSKQIPSFTSIFQTSIQQEAYKLSRQILVIEIYNLQNVKTHLNLKYCYLHLPSININTLDVQEQRDFKEFKRVIMKKLRITANNIYLYHKDGTPVYTHRQLRKVDLVIFAGNCRTFAGIDKIFSSEANLITLKKVIEKLESKVNVNEDFINLNNSQNNVNIDMGLVLEGSSNNNSPTSTPLTKQGSRTLKHKNSSMSLTSKNATPKSNQNRSQDNKAAKRSQFADYFKDDEDNNNKKKFFFEDDMEDDGENVPEKEVVDVNTCNLQFKKVGQYLNKVMKYLDLFFSKFDYNWRVDKEKEEIDLYLKYQSSLPKRMKKNKIIDFKLKGFEQRKANLEKLKRLNRDLFASNIGKTLQEYELNENDLNSVYLLYRSILNIQSQLISMDNVIKEDDIMLKLDKFDHLTLENKAFVESLCNYQEIINWQNFVKMLKNISNLDDEKKIDMFVQVFDSDNSGTLSLDEISHFAKLTMEFIINEDNSPGFTKLLEDYFTKLLFTSLREEGKSEIPMEKIKKTILEKNENSDILCFFCGTQAPES